MYLETREGSVFSMCSVHHEKISFLFFNDAAKDSSHHWNIVGGHRHHQLWWRGLLPRHKHVLPKRGGWILLLSGQGRVLLRGLCAL